MAETRKIMIIAGEASGDAHGAKLVKALREIEPETEFDFFGAAGPQMREAGVDPIVLSDGLSIVGLLEIGRALPIFLRAMRDLKKTAVTRMPDAAILVDFPDFNLKLAKSLKNKGVTVIYYISPQIWAWRKYRIASIRKYVDLLITILPFENEWYAERGILHVEYVGNPLANEVHAERSKTQFCADHGLDPSRPIVSLLPGSRHKEILRILPPMLRSAAQVSATVPHAQFIVAMASGGHRSDVEHAKNKVARSGESLPKHLIVVENETYDALNASDAAAVTSGTATLETGIIGTPMAIVYKTSVTNWSLLEPLVSADHYGLINLIAGERLVKELIQSDFTAESLSSELLRLLRPKENAAMRKKLKEATDKLGHGGASKRAAAAVLRTIDSEALKKRTAAT